MDSNLPVYLQTYYAKCWKNAFNLSTNVLVYILRKLCFELLRPEEKRIKGVFITGKIIETFVTVYIEIKRQLRSDESLTSPLQINKNRKLFLSDISEPFHADCCSFIWNWRWFRLILNRLRNWGSHSFWHVRLHPCPVFIQNTR